jgi:membrane associated rhomboid family serine protease
MLVIPISQERSTVRRQPWVSYAVMGLCFASYLLVNLLSGQARRAAELHETEKKLTETLEHSPFLAVPPEVRPFLSPETLAQYELAGQRAAKRGELPPPERLAEMQRQLDELGDRFADELQGMPAQRLGYVPARGPDWRLLSSLFVHAGLMHLLGNMLFFFLTAPFIEDVYGRPLFAGFYLTAGVVAALTHAGSDSSSPVGLVGASGAIAGLMGAFLVRFGARRIEFLFLPIPVLPMIRTQFFMPAYVVLPFWLGQQLLFAQSEDDGSSVAWWAHVGGFVFGTAFAFLIRITRIEERLIHPVIESKTTLLAHPSLVLASEARTRGDLTTAERELARVLREQPANIDGWLEAYELALARGDGAGVSRAGARLLELYEKAGEIDLARQLIDDVRWPALRPPRLLLAAATTAERLADGRKALEFYEELVRAAPSDPLALRALILRGELLLRNQDRRGARLAFEAAQAHPAFGPSWSGKVERGLAGCNG